MLVIMIMVLVSLQAGPPPTGGGAGRGTIPRRLGSKDESKVFAVESAVKHHDHTSGSGELNRSGWLNCFSLAIGEDFPD